MKVFLGMLHREKFSPFFVVMWIWDILFRIGKIRSAHKKLFSWNFQSFFFLKMYIIKDEFDHCEVYNCLNCLNLLKFVCQKRSDSVLNLDPDPNSPKSSGSERIRTPTPRFKTLHVLSLWYK
jgi:hypothetical protein